MKNNLKQRIIAILLCIVMIISSINLSNIFKNNFNASSDYSKTNVVANDSLQTVIDTIGRYKFHFIGNTNAYVNYNNYWTMNGHSFIRGASGYSHCEEMSTYEKDHTSVYQGNSSGSYLDENDLIVNGQKSSIYKAYLIVDYNGQKVSDLSTLYKYPITFVYYGEDGKNQKSIELYPDTYIYNKTMSSVTNCGYGTASTQCTVKPSFFASDGMGIVDVTDFVNTNGFGWYYCCNIPYPYDNSYTETNTSVLAEYSHDNNDNAAQWQLLIIEQNQEIPLRILQLKLGNTQVPHNSVSIPNDAKTVTVDVSSKTGLTAKKTGTVTGQFLYMTGGAWTATSPYLQQIRYSVNNGGYQQLTTSNGLRQAGIGFPLVNDINGENLKTRQNYTHGELYYNGNGIDGFTTSSTGKWRVSGKDLELLDMSFPAGTSSVSLTGYNSNSGFSIQQIGVAMDIDAPTYTSTQTTTTSLSNKTITISGKMTNKGAEDNENVGVVDGTLTVTLSKGLIPDSSTVTINTGDSTITKTGTYNSSNNTVIFTGIDNYKSGAYIEYTIKSHRSETNVEVYYNNAYLSGYYYNSGNASTDYIEGFCVGSSSAKAFYDLIINPNGGTYNGSSETITETIMSGEEKDINVPLKSDYTFKYWEIIGDGTYLKSKDTLVMGLSDTTLIAHYKINEHNVECIDVAGYPNDDGSFNIEKIFKSNGFKRYNYNTIAKGSDWGTISPYANYKYFGDTSIVLKEEPISDDAFVYNKLLNEDYEITQENSSYDETEIISSKEIKTFSIDAFPQEYSGGYICSPTGYECSNNFTLTWYDNYSGLGKLGYLTPDTVITSKNENYWIKYLNAAVMDGQMLDIVLYPWSEQEGIPTKNYVASMGKNDIGFLTGGNIEKGHFGELHFYKAGTNIEVPFTGIIIFSQLDRDEKYAVYCDSIGGVFLHPSTHITTDINLTYKKDNVNGSDYQTSFSGTVDEPYTYEGSYLNGCAYVPIKATLDKPLILQNCSTRSLGSMFGYTGNVITYNILGEKPSNISNKYELSCVEYGNFDPNRYDPVKINGYNSNYIFSGWYWDEELTIPISETRIYNNVNLDLMSSDATFYGKFMTRATLNINPNGGTFNNTKDVSIFSDASGKTIILEEPIRDGYIFMGWETSPSFSGNLNENEYTYGDAGSIDCLVAKWAPNIVYRYFVLDVSDYTILHQQEQLDGTYKTIDTEKLTGTIGTSITPAVKTYEGFTSPSTQTVTIKENGGTTVIYKYIRNSYPVTYIDVVDNQNGKELGRSQGSLSFGSTATGATKGIDTADNKYYKGYYYSSCTTAEVTTNGATVYRIFKLRTIDINGSVNWNDKSNAYGSRQENVTITLFRNGTKIDTVTGLTDKDNNTFSFKGLPKYDTSTGEAYVYTVSQSDVVSNHNPEEKYTTDVDTSGFNFTNTLTNSTKENPEPEWVGFKVNGSIVWEDYDNQLGIRPDNIEIKLYQNGVLHKTQVVDKNTTGYSFVNLDKYDENQVPYTYQVEEVFTAKIMTWNSTTKQYETIDAYSIKVEGFDFTNKLVDTEEKPIIPVKPSHINTLTIKLDFNNNIDWSEVEKTSSQVTSFVTLKQMETLINNGTVSYTSNYNGMEYKAIVNELGVTINNIPSGKYEIVESNDNTFVLEGIDLQTNSSISVVNENNKWYLIIAETDQHQSGTISLNMNVDSFNGVDDSMILNNLYSLGNTSTAQVMILSMFSDEVTVPEYVEPITYTITYKDCDVVDNTKYSENSEATLKDCEIEGFLGWSEDNEAVEPQYIVGDKIKLEKDLILYPVIKTSEQSSEETTEEEVSEEEEATSEIEESSETEETTEETVDEEETSETKTSNEIEESEENNDSVENSEELSDNEKSQNDNIEKEELSSIEEEIKDSAFSE